MGHQGIAVNDMYEEDKIEGLQLGLFLLCLQKIVTLSTIEVEYVAATKAGNEMIWLHGFLDELGKKQEMGILHSDSQSTIFIAKNSAFHSNSKVQNTTLSVTLLKINW